MPLVRITCWQRGLRPGLPPAPLWTSGSFASSVLIGTIILEPMYAVILLIVAVGGIGCAFLIRMMNRD